MPIETRCSTCGSCLRVDDRYAGRRARCPVCQSAYVVPQSAPAAPATRESAVTPVGASRSLPAQAPPTRLWTMRTPEGQTFGPVGKAELDQWVSEGRLTADCTVRGENGAAWQPASQLYPALAEVAPALPADDEVIVATPVRGAENHPRTAPGDELPGPAAGQSQRPHRGELILALGIVGLLLGSVLVCPIISMMAWVMGSADLNEMRQGRMDERGHKLTRTGQILGAVYSAIWIVAMAVLLFVVLRITST